MHMTGTRRAVVVAFTGLLVLFSSVLACSSASASPISAKKARLQAVQAQLQKVYRQSDVAVEKYNEATGKLATVRQQIKQNAHSLRLAEYRLEIANKDLQQRAQDLYKTGAVSIVDVVLASRSFDELVTQLDMARRLGNSDVDLARAAAAYRQEIADRRLALEADRKQAIGLVAQRKTSKDQVLALQAQLENASKGLKHEIAQIEAEQAAAAKAAASRAAAAARAAEAAKTSSSSSGGSSGGSYSGGSSGGGGSSHSSVVSIAQRYLGVPYVWGGASPSGFDCSGLTMYVYAQIGIYLAHGATAQQHASNPVSLGSLEPGDLVFFGNASYSYHVGIYVGGGQMIAAPHTGAVVSYCSISGAWIGGRF
jgi:peptidoglycan DL-endopeptidase CwlO